MSDQELLYEVKDQVAWITLNREARRNALSLDMIDLFFEYLVIKHFAQVLIWLPAFSLRTMKKELKNMLHCSSIWPRSPNQS